MKALADYDKLSHDELRARIQEVRDSAGDRLAVFAHYYIVDEVVELADFVGDSLALAKRAADSKAEALLFCGVRFMLETADILANRPEKIAARGGKRMLVLAPDLTAGCPMADMITSEQAYAWKDELSELVDFNDFTPVSYVNSSAAIKAFCGEFGGAICTSANAEKTLRDALAKRPKALFMPDSRLGKTTALRVGIKPEEIAVWNPALRKPYGGLSSEDIERARVMLGRILPNAPVFLREVHWGSPKQPDAQVWVHPESQRDAVELSDGYGSTSKLHRRRRQRSEGRNAAIGTEWKLVDRLRRQNPDKTILWPGDEPQVCGDMSKTTLAKVAWVLDKWRSGHPVSVVKTDPQYVENAYLALKSLLD